MNYLDRNEFNFPPAPGVVQALNEFQADTFCFYTRIYDEGKKSIFSVYLAQEFGVPESQVLLGYGAEDLLKQAVHFFLTTGSHGNRKVLIPTFSWWYYKSIADEVDGQTLLYPIVEDGDTFRYDIDALRSMVEAEKPRVVLVASPNNPTGNALTPNELEQILSFLPQDVVLLVDEAYASFLGDDNSYIRDLVARHPNILILRTLSKFYGLPGLRLGFGFMGDSEMMRRFARYANKYLGYDRLSEDLGIAALKSHDYYRGVSNVMQQAREMYESEIGALPGFKVYKSQANFILIAYPPQLKDALQREMKDIDHKIKFMNEPGLEHHIRITLGREQQNRAVCDAILRCAKAEQ